MLHNGELDDPGNDPAPVKSACPGNCVNGFIGGNNGDTVTLCPEHRAASIARIRRQRERRRPHGARRPVSTR